MVSLQAGPARAPRSRAANPLTLHFPPAVHVTKTEKVRQWVYFLRLCTGVCVATQANTIWPTKLLHLGARGRGRRSSAGGGGGDPCALPGPPAASVNGSKSNTARLNTSGNWICRTVRKLKHPTPSAKPRNVSLTVQKCEGCLTRTSSTDQSKSQFTGGKRNRLPLKHLQHFPGGRHGNDVTLWNTWRGSKNFRPPHTHTPPVITV